MRSFGNLMKSPWGSLNETQGRESVKKSGSSVGAASALDTRSGEILGKTAQRHTSTEFVDFLAQVVASQPRGREIHVIADKLSAHTTKLVEDFLATHPQVRIPFTPTYSSWLNQVEIWFAKIQRQVIARGNFSSVDDLRRKILRYIRHYNKTATPIKWTYFSPAKRITWVARSSVTLH